MYGRFHSLPLLPLPLTDTQLQISMCTIFLFGSLRCRTANFRRNHFRLGAHESRIVQAFAKVRKGEKERWKRNERDDCGTSWTTIYQMPHKWILRSPTAYTLIRICIRTWSDGSHSYSYRFSVNFSQAFSGDLNVTLSRIRYAFAVKHQVSSASECLGSASNRCDTHNSNFEARNLYFFFISLLGLGCRCYCLPNIMAITLRPYRHNQRQCEAWVYTVSPWREWVSGAPCHFPFSARIFPFVVKFRYTHNFNLRRVCICFASRQINLPLAMNSTNIYTTIQFIYSESHSQAYKQKTILITLHCV